MTKPKMPKIRGWLRGGRLAEIYKAKDGWRWRLWARNGRIIAESGEAYQQSHRCVDMIIDLSCGFPCTYAVKGVHVK